MPLVLLFFGSGILLGFLSHKNKKIISLVDILTNWSIYLFLFLLGNSVGINEEIIKNFPKLGRYAFILSIGAVTGSIAVTYFVSLTFLKKDEK